MPLLNFSPRAWRDYDPNAPATPQVVEALRKLRLQAGIDPNDPFGQAAQQAQGIQGAQQVPGAPPMAQPSPSPVFNRGDYIEQQVGQ
jgi:hypothetical protein